MEKPKLFYVFSQEKEYCEKTDSKPIETFIPNQSIKLAELVRRFESGQRLNVHQNFDVGENCTNGNYIYEEDFDDAAPDDVHDVVDVQRYYEDHQQRVDNYNKAKANASSKKENEDTKQAPASQVSEDVPPDPAAKPC